MRSLYRLPPGRATDLNVDRFPLGALMHRHAGECLKAVGTLVVNFTVAIHIRARDCSLWFPHYCTMALFCSEKGPLRPSQNLKPGGGGES
jgi:hypothetical protein